MQVGTQQLHRQIPEAVVKKQTTSMNGSRQGYKSNLARDLPTQMRCRPLLPQTLGTCGELIRPDLADGLRDAGYLYRSLLGMNPSNALNSLPSDSSANR
jgi:hypothetical protein